MAGAGEDKQGAKGGEGQSTKESLAARRRRIEMMRERRELMAMLDDFGDGDLNTLDLELLEEDDDTVGRWVTPDDGAPEDDEDDGIAGLDDDDDYYDDEDYEDED